MIVKIVVEIIPNNNYRWRYSEEIGAFIEEKSSSIYSGGKSFKGIYGWVEGYGQPPHPHNDVLVITDKKHELGETISGKIIGVFIRCDGDHKLVCVESDRNIEDFHELPEGEKEMLKRVYSGKYKGDAWLGKEKAIEILGNHDRTINWL